MLLQLLLLHAGAPNTKYGKNTEQQAHCPWADWHSGVSLNQLYYCWINLTSDSAHGANSNLVQQSCFPQVSYRSCKVLLRESAPFHSPSCAIPWAAMCKVSRHRLRSLWLAGRPQSKCTTSCLFRCLSGSAHTFLALSFDGTPVQQIDEISL